MTIQFNKIKTRIPFSDGYVYLLGAAIYIFAYYESAVIDVFSYLESDFRNKYYREESWTSGALFSRTAQIVKSNNSINNLQQVHYTFGLLVKERNQLVHSHPITDPVDGQIFYYQTDVRKTVSDFKWNEVQIEKFIRKVEEQILIISEVLNTLR